MAPPTAGRTGDLAADGSRVGEAGGWAGAAVPTRLSARHAASPRAAPRVPRRRGPWPAARPLGPGELARDVTGCPEDSTESGEGGHVLLGRFCPVGC